MWQRVGTRFLPFADAASAEMPLPRLLRLALFQCSVGMAMVMLVGTLNRVMIVELGVPAFVVSVMVALPVLVAPLRTLIGFRSDHHRSELGWRRVPYIWMGSLLQFGGFSIMPFALLVLAGAGQSAQAPAWVGQLGAGLAFLLVGAGMHTVQTAGLALATDLSPEHKHPQVVGLMYVMLLVGMVASALLFGHWLSDYTPGRLVQAVQAAAIITLVLNVVALWKQEPRSRQRRPGTPVPETFGQAWRAFGGMPQVQRRLWVLALGTMAFAMEDVLLEPYGGEVLAMSVSDTTLLTATLALGGLAGFAWASRPLAWGGSAAHGRLGPGRGRARFCPGHAGLAPAIGGGVHHRGVPDWPGRRLVRPRHPDRHHALGTARPRWPGPGRLGRGAGQRWRPGPGLGGAAARWPAVVPAQSGGLLGGVRPGADPALADPVAGAAPDDLARHPPIPPWAQCLKATLNRPSNSQETTMEIKTVIFIMFVVFCLFVLANWLNRPRK